MSLHNPAEIITTTSPHLKFNFADPFNAEKALLPLRATFVSQFDTQHTDRWLIPELFLQYYLRQKDQIVPALVEPTSRHFLVYVEELINNKPVASLIATQNLFLPDYVHIIAIATLKEHQKQGIGARLINYFARILNTHAIGTVLLADTNANSQQVAGGWSPVPAWKKWGFKELGRMPHYGTEDSEVGDGVFLYANIARLASEQRHQNSTEGTN